MLGSCHGLCVHIRINFHAQKNAAQPVTPRMQKDKHRPTVHDIGTACSRSPFLETKTPQISPERSIMMAHVSIRGHLPQPLTIRTHTPLPLSLSCTTFAISHSFTAGTQSTTQTMGYIKLEYDTHRIDDLGAHNCLEIHLVRHDEAH